MIILDMEQGSPEWLAARLGIPSASEFSRLVTPGGKPSTQINGYCDELVAEVLMGHGVKDTNTPAMQRGTELEPEARAWYEFQYDVDVEEVGFVLRDDGEVGCSPDGLILDKSGLEIKCPKADKHIGWMRGGVCPAEHYPQVQGCMYICEREQWQFLSYHPELPEFIVTVSRDDKYIQTLENQISALIDMKSDFLDKLQAA